MDTTTLNISKLDACFHLKSLGCSVFLRAPLGVPEWGSTQKKIIANHLLNGELSNSYESDVQGLEENLSRLVDRSFCVTTASGRDAIKLALLSMQVQPGERIVMPSFCCQSVLLPVLELGLTPVFADVGDDWQIDPKSVRRVMRPGDRALIVPHLFGRLADMTSLTQIAHQCGALVIDDAAQAFGLKGSWGWAGQGGDIGVFSFGLFKPISAMGGGALVTNNNELFEKAKVLAAKAPRDLYNRRSIIKTYIKMFWRKHSFALYLYLRSRQQKESCKDQFSINTNSGFRRISNLNSLLVASQLQQTLQLRQVLNEKADKFAQALRNIHFIKSPPPRYGGFPRWVIELTSEFADEGFYRQLFAYLIKRGIEVQPTYIPLHHFIRTLGDDPLGEYSRCDDLSSRLLCLPFSRHIDINYVFRCLEEFALLNTGLSFFRHAGFARK